MANINQMIADLDRQIASLTTARNALAEAHGGIGAKKAGGRTKRTLSPEAREKIAAAQRKRWAKVGAKKAVKKKAVGKKKVPAVEA